MRGGAWGGWGVGESQGGLKGNSPWILGVRVCGEGHGNLGTRRGRSWQAGPGRSEREGDTGCGITGAEQAGVERGRGGVGHGRKLGRGLRKEMERVGPAGLGWVGSWVLGGFRGLLFSFSISNSNKSI